MLYLASKRRHAQSAINTIQADRRSVVDIQADRRSVVDIQADRRSVVSTQAQRSVVDTQAQRSVVDTQAQRSVAQEMPMKLPKHLEEMRPTMVDSIVMSHVSDMQERHSPYSTTLRGFAACMVLIAPIGASHASGMMRKSVLEKFARSYWPRTTPSMKLCMDDPKSVVIFSLFFKELGIFGEIEAKHFGIFG